MLNAYYSKGYDYLDIFKNQKICNDTTFKTHLNKHNVIYIDMNAIYTTITDIMLYNLRRFYIVKKEENTFNDRIDIVYYSIKDKTAMIVELKINESAKPTIKQIKDNNYHGDVYLVGINANIKTNGDTKEYLHDTLIEVVNI